MSCFAVSASRLQQRRNLWLANVQMRLSRLEDLAIGKMQWLRSQDTSKVSLTRKQRTLLSLYLAAYKDCAEMLSSQHAKEKADSWHMLYKILSNVRFLARQGLPLRGSGQGDEGNFIQLLKLRGTDDLRMTEWVERKSSKYTTADMQNEMLTVMSLRVLREITSAIQKVLFYTVIVDETTDCSNKEQVVLVIRWVDEDLIVHESFVGLYSVPAIDANTLTYYHHKGFIGTNELEYEQNPRTVL